MKLIDYIIVFAMVSCVIAWVIYAAITDISSLIEAIAGTGML